MSAHPSLYYAFYYRMKRLIPPLMTFLLGLQAGHASEGDTIQLPEPNHRGIALEEALRQRRTVREFSLQRVPTTALSQLLWSAQGVTSQRGLRTAPSAGALYPLEIDVIVGVVAGLPAGVYRYRPDNHTLQKVLGGDVRKEAARAALGQGWMADAPVLIIINAVARRTERKYGKRAELYVPVEAGAAAQNRSACRRQL